MSGSGRLALSWSDPSLSQKMSRVDFIALDQLFLGENLKPALPSHLRSGGSMRLATFAQEIPQGSATDLGLFAPHIVGRSAHCSPLAFWVPRSYGGDAPLQ